MIEGHGPRAHAHVGEVDAPQTFVGVCPKGARIPHAGQPARVIVVLLAPASMPPEAYLRQLAVTAQLVRADATVDALVEAESSADARALLLATLRNDLSPSDVADSASAQAD